MRILGLLLAGLLVGLFAPHLAAQPAPQHYTLRDGLPSDHVYHCLQDGNGFMWFATAGGVVRYDGYAFNTLTTADGLPSNDVWKLYEDGLGRIWPYAFSYQLAYIRDGACHAVRGGAAGRLMKPVQFLQLGDVLVVVYLLDGRETGIVLIDRNGTATVCNGAKRLFPWLLLDRDGAFWMDPLERTAFKPRAGWATPGIQTDTAATPYLRLARLTGLYEEGSFLCIDPTRDDSLFRYDMRARLKDAVSVKSLVRSWPEYPQFLSQHEQGPLLATNKGLYFLTSKLTLRRVDSFSRTIAGQTVLTWFHEARDGSRWYTSSTGIYCLRRMPPAFEPFEALNRRSDHRLVAADARQRLYLQDIRTLAVSVLDTAGITPLTLPRPERLLGVGTDTGGIAYCAFPRSLLCWDGKRPALRSPVGAGELLQVQDLDGTGYARAMSGGLANYRVAAPLSAGDVALVSYNALWVLSGPAHRRVLAEIYRDRFYAVKAMPDVPHAFYCCNDRKLLAVRRVRGRWAFSEPLSLASTTRRSVIDLAVDRWGHAIVNDGVSLVVVRPDTVLRRVWPGVQLAGARLCMADDRLYVAGGFGVLRLRIHPDGRLEPDAMAANSARAFRQVQAVFLFGDRVGIRTDNGAYLVRLHPAGEAALQACAGQLLVGGQALRQGRVDTIQVPRGTGSLDLDAINYQGLGPVRYYRRAAGTGAWQLLPGGALPVDRLPAGRWHTVQCRYEDQLWRSPAHTVVVYKIPLWYQRPGWRAGLKAGSLLGIGLLLAALVSFTRWRVLRAHRRRQALNDLELRALYAQINPHFIFNTLGTAQYFIANDDNTAAYKHIAKFSRLLRSYLKSARSRVVTLAEELSHIRDYIELQQARFSEAFSYEIQVAEGIRPEEVPFPSLLLQPLVENAIVHGLFHKRSTGSLRLAFEPDESGALLCTIEDDGIGRAAAAALGGARSDRRDSYGTGLMDDLIAVVDRTSDLKIDLEYEDKTPPQSGTLVRLRIRYKRHAHS